MQETMNREYVARRPFTFAGKDYERGDVFNHPECDGEKLRRMYFARRIELAPVLAEEQRKPKKRKTRSDKGTKRTVMW